MNPSTPIETWPAQRYHGAPGYSARHFRAVSPPADDPLRVAERIVARVNAEAVHAEMCQRYPSLDDLDAALSWQSKELSARDQRSWEALCGSLDAVIAALELAPQTPAMRRLVKVAMRAKKNCGESR